MRVIRDEEDIREGLAALAVADPRLLPVIDAAGPVPLRLMEPGFAGLAFIVVSQMISKASAAAIWRRMSDAGPVTPEVYLAHPPEIVAGFGLSRAKAATLVNLAAAVSRSGGGLSDVLRRPSGRLPLRGRGPSGFARKSVRAAAAALRPGGDRDGGNLEALALRRGPAVLGLLRRDAAPGGDADIPLMAVGGC